MGQWHGMEFMPQKLFKKERERENMMVNHRVREDIWNTYDRNRTCIQKKNLKSQQEKNKQNPLENKQQKN